MGFKDAKADLIEKAAIWYGKDWLRRALAGEKGEGVQQAALWVLSNKGPIGAVLVAIGGCLAAGVAQGVFHGSGVTVAAFVVSYFGTYLAGGGQVKSDGYYKPQLEALKEVKADEKANR